MSFESFLLEKAELKFDNSGSSTVSFLGPGAEKNETHITLIAGANGTSKSRILASLVEQFCDLKQLQRINSKSSRRHSPSGMHGLLCTRMSTLRNGQLSEFQAGIHFDSEEPFPHFTLPSRILVLSNLVMDKFHFPKGGQAENQFYHYLGVRQATNLTTTGSLDRSVTEAVLSIASDEERLGAFQAWIELVFSGSRELALQFHRLRKSEIEEFLKVDDKIKFIHKRIQRRMDSGRSVKLDERIEKIAQDVIEIFNFLKEKASEYQAPDIRGKKQSDLLLQLSMLSDEDKARLAKLAPLFLSASRAGYSAWPSLCFEVNSWLQFNQLSSGEQNILSVGAKLIAYARPGCLIAIDEPEVSLNVAWQQHYTDLVRRSLVHSPGSHVLIATHSPHLIASLSMGSASVVMIEKEKEMLSFKTVDARFEGWGSESVLYQVLGIPSASSFLFHRELAKVLTHIQNGGLDKNLIGNFLQIAKKIDFAGIDPLEEVVAEIISYAEKLD
jgi:hypothetical protein